MGKIDETTDSQGLRALLAAIAADLQAGTYRIGSWRAFVEQARGAPLQASRDLSTLISAVSNLIHSRRALHTYPLGALTVVEIVCMLGGFFALAAGARRDSWVLLTIAAALLVLTLQPLVKVACGRALGLSYSYGFTMGGEPRYKLAFGTYLAATPARRILFHLSGTLGSVLGLLLVATTCVESLPALGRVLFGLAALHAAVQVVFFAMVSAGRDRFFGFGPLRFSSAGAAADEWRALRRNTARTAPLEQKRLS